MFAPIERLSKVDPDGFPFDWYAIAREDHFWFRMRIRSFMKFVPNFLSPKDPLNVLEIGCGNGLVRRQLESVTNWKTDGADINEEALKLNTGLEGKTYLYNIHDRNESLKDKYDAVILFDVLEHIPETTEFLESCLFHLKPGGHLFINVPALNRYRSDYDLAVGHVRRYDKVMMAEEFSSLNARVVGMRYWALTLVLPLILRKYLVTNKKKDTAAIVEKGLQPPNPFIDKLFYSVMNLENRIFPNPFVGASLLAAIQKESNGEKK